MSPIIVIPARLATTRLPAKPLASGHLKAETFSRTAAWRRGRLYHHICGYAYSRAALERFALPPSSGERRERLEQLRALENGLRIDVALVERAAFGVDSPAALERARAILRQ